MDLKYRILRVAVKFIISISFCSKLLFIKIIYHHRCSTNVQVPNLTYEQKC